MLPGEAVDSIALWSRLRGLEPITRRSLTPKLTRAQLLAGLEASPGFATVTESRLEVLSW